MLAADLPLTRDLVLIGGGHAHALVLRRWGMAPLPGVRLTLINPEPTAPYTGMLPGHIAGHYPRAALEIDLVRLARFARARLILGSAAGIDRAERRIAVPGRPDVAFDVASVDIGVTSGLPDLPGFAEHGVGAKPMGPFAERWEAFLARVQAGEAAASVAILGGGVAGVELALATAERLAKAGADPDVCVIEAGPQALTGLGPRARAALLAHMVRRGVTLVTDARPVRVEAGAVELADGRRVAAGLCVAVAGAHPHAWLTATGLALERGFISVTPNLQSLTDPALFAVGDCAHLSDTPRPKAGVFAVRQAPVLFHNLRAALSGGALLPFRPQRDYLKLISTGGKGAVADKFGLRLDGAWVWHLKDRIDRAFMRKLTDLPKPQAPPPPDEMAFGLREALADQPLCGGCGAKVGHRALRRALADQPAMRRADVLSGPGDDAAVLRFGCAPDAAARQVLTTDHLRSFTADPWLMARIAAIHALGDVWAMGAAPQAALSQIILPRLGPALQDRTLAEIMAAATEVFAAEGADVVGGHTSTGAELTLGFTVTGLCDGPLVGKGGAQAGDRLILTKPLGTGVILAAEMAGTAPGRAVAAAWASMARPQGQAAALLARHASAMTDVTGFGLAGHLLEMLDASYGVRAVLHLAKLPLLPGALTLSRAGQVASLYAQNREVAARMALPPDPAVPLLFDPQTAGGLLAALPAAVADQVLAAVRALGFDAAIIGQIEAGIGQVEAGSGQVEAGNARVEAGSARVEVR